MIFYEIRFTLGKVFVFFEVPSKVFLTLFRAVAKVKCLLIGFRFPSTLSETVPIIKISSLHHKMHYRKTFILKVLIMTNLSKSLLKSLLVRLFVVLAEFKRAIFSCTLTLLLARILTNKENCNNTDFKYNTNNYQTRDGQEESTCKMITLSRCEPKRVFCESIASGVVNATIAAKPAAAVTAPPLP